MRSSPIWRNWLADEQPHAFRRLVSDWGLSRADALFVVQSATRIFYERHSKAWHRKSQKEFEKLYGGILSMQAVQRAVSHHHESLNKEASTLGTTWSASVLNCSLDSMLRIAKSPSFTPPSDWRSWSLNFVRREILAISLLAMRDTCLRRLSAPSIQVSDAEEVFDIALCRIAARDDLWQTYRSASNPTGFVVEVAKRCAMELVDSRKKSAMRRLVSLKKLIEILICARTNRPMARATISRSFTKSLEKFYKHWQASLSSSDAALAQRIVKEGECPNTIAKNDAEYHEIHDRIAEWLTKLENEVALLIIPRGVDYEPSQTDPEPNLDSLDWELERLAIHAAYASLENTAERPLRAVLLLLTKWSESQKRKSRRTSSTDEDEWQRPLKQTTIGSLPIYAGGPPGNVKISLWKQQAIEKFQTVLSNLFVELADGKEAKDCLSTDVIAQTIRLMLVDRLAFCQKGDNSQGLRYRQAALLFWYTFRSFPFLDIGEDLELACFFPQRKQATAKERSSRREMVNSFANEGALRWLQLAMHYNGAKRDLSLPNVVVQEIEYLQQQFPPNDACLKDPILNSAANLDADNLLSVSVGDWS